MSEVTVTQESFWGGHVTTSIVTFFEGDNQINKFRGLLSDKERLLVCIAKKYSGRNAPAQLVRALKEKKVQPKLPPTPMRITRDELPQIAESGFLDTHWKTVYLDKVLVENRYSVTIYEEHKYELGHYVSSSIQIKSLISVVDGVTGCVLKKWESRIPDTLEKDRFSYHLGIEVLQVGVLGEKMYLDIRAMGGGIHRYSFSLERRR